GPEMEKNLRHAMQISDGDWSILWSSGLSIGLWAVAIIGLLLPVIVGPILRRRMQAARARTQD
ncbi:MAG: tripartite tricarboxylate transporter permease, partial [Salinicola sp.]|nr:tripartite tricarboxylate transporter permease [Salinicola sp.]